MSKFIEKHRKGLIGTIVFHTALALFMLFTSLTTTPPTFPEPEGVVVNYGTDETGLGEEEPAPSPIQETAQNTPETSAQATPPDESAEDAIADNTPSPVLTQETEDAPAIAAERKKEQERKRAEEIEKKRIADEQKRLAEEADRKAEEQRKQAEAAKQAEALAAQKIRDRASKAFGQSNGSTSSSQGIAGGDGNQGKPDGQAGVNNYKGGGVGYGGIDWSLNGREAIELPHPSRGIQASGKVIVEIIVDNNGQVIEATPGKKGSTTTDGRLYEAAQRAAMKARFNVSPSSPPHQKGTITYIFELQ